MKQLRIAAVLAACLVAGAVQAAPQSACYHRNAQSETEIGYCEAVRSGNLLYVSGHVGAGEMAGAVKGVYDRLGETLAAHGLTFADVVKENVYSTDLDAFIKNKEVRKPYYKGAFPAATWVQVQRLYLPSFVLEVELVAAFPQK